MKSLKSYALAMGALTGGLVLGGAGLTYAASASDPAADKGTPNLADTKSTPTAPGAAKDSTSATTVAPSPATLSSADLSRIVNDVSSVLRALPAPAPAPSAHPDTAPVGVVGEKSVRFPCSVTFRAGYASETRCDVNIPPGKQLIIDTYSASVDLTKEAIVTVLVSDYTVGGLSEIHLPLPTVTPDFPTHLSGSGQTHIVVNGGGSEALFLAISALDAGATAHAYFLGHLVDTP